MENNEHKTWWQKLRDRLTSNTAVQPVPDIAAMAAAQAAEPLKPYEGRINTGAGHRSFYVRATSLKEAHKKITEDYLKSIKITVTPYLGNKKVV